MPDDLDLLAELRLTEAFYLDFRPETFQEILHMYQQIVLDVQAKKQNAREKQIAALAWAGQASIWALWLFEDSKNQTKVNHVEECCRHAVSMAGDAPDVKAALSMATGRMMQYRGDIDAALANYESAVKANRMYPAALIYKAIGLVIKAGLGVKPPASTPALSAIAAFERGDKAESDRKMAEVLALAGEAEALLNESIECRPQGEGYARRNLCDMLIHLGRVYAKTGQLFHDGLEAYRRAIRADDQFYQAWNNLAYRVDESGTAEVAYLHEAAQAAKRAVTLAKPEEKNAVLSLLERIQQKIKAAREC